MLSKHWILWTTITLALPFGTRCLLCLFSYEPIAFSTHQFQIGFCPGVFATRILSMCPSLPPNQLSTIVHQSFGTLISSEVVQLHCPSTCCNTHTWSVAPFVSQLENRLHATVCFLLHCFAKYCTSVPFLVSTTSRPLFPTTLESAHAHAMLSTHLKLWKTTSWSKPSCTWYLVSLFAFELLVFLTHQLQIVERRATTHASPQIFVVAWLSGTKFLLSICLAAFGSRMLPTSSSLPPNQLCATSQSPFYIHVSTAKIQSCILSTNLNTAPCFASTNDRRLSPTMLLNEHYSPMSKKLNVFLR